MVLRPTNYLTIWSRLNHLQQLRGTLCSFSDIILVQPQNVDQGPLYFSKISHLYTQS